MVTYEKATVKGYLSSFWSFEPEFFPLIVLVTYSSSSLEGSRYCSLEAAAHSQKRILFDPAQISGLTAHMQFRLLVYFLRCLCPKRLVTIEHGIDDDR